MLDISFFLMQNAFSNQYVSSFYEQRWLLKIISIEKYEYLDLSVDQSMRKREGLCRS
jgi:hypothetical protein